MHPLYFPKERIAQLNGEAPLEGFVPCCLFSSIFTPFSSPYKTTGESESSLPLGLIFKRYVTTALPPGSAAQRQSTLPRQYITTDIQTSEVLFTPLLLFFLFNYYMKQLKYLLLSHMLIRLTSARNIIRSSFNA